MTLSTLVNILDAAEIAHIDYYSANELWMVAVDGAFEARQVSDEPDKLALTSTWPNPPLSKVVDDPAAALVAVAAFI